MLRSVATALAALAVAGLPAAAETTAEERSKARAKNLVICLDGVAPTPDDRFVFSAVCSVKQEELKEMLDDPELAPRTALERNKYWLVRAAVAARIRDMAAKDHGLISRNSCRQLREQSASMKKVDLSALEPEHARSIPVLISNLQGLIAKCDEVHPAG